MYKRQGVDLRERLQYRGIIGQELTRGALPAALHEVEEAFVDHKEGSGLAAFRGYAFHKLRRDSMPGGIIRIAQKQNVNI